MPTQGGGGGGGGKPNKQKQKCNLTTLGQDGFSYI